MRQEGGIKLEFIDLSVRFKRIPWLLYQDETVGLGGKIPIKIPFVIVNNGPFLPSVVISCFEVTSVCVCCHLGKMAVH